MKHMERVFFSSYAVNQILLEHIWVIIYQEMYQRGSGEACDSEIS